MKNYLDRSLGRDSAGITFSVFDRLEFKSQIGFAGFVGVPRHCFPLPGGKHFTSLSR